MVKAQVYSAKEGSKSTTVDLPEMFSEKINASLLAQAIRVYEDNRHPGTARAKTRGEITASTRKIYRQKGTGGARHGAISAPIFVGGGVAHGPKGVKRVLSLPQKMREKALSIALSLKVSENRVFVIDGLADLKKTKDAQKIINRITEKGGVAQKRFTIALSEANKEAVKAFRNISNVSVLPFENLNARDVYVGGVLLVDKAAIEVKKTTKTPVKKTKRKVEVAKKTKIVTAKKSTRKSK